MSFFRHAAATPIHKRSMNIVRIPVTPIRIERGIVPAPMNSETAMPIRQSHSILVRRLLMGVEARSFCRNGDRRNSSDR